VNKGEHQNYFGGHFPRQNTRPMFMDVHDLFKGLALPAAAKGPKHRDSWGLFCLISRGCPRRYYQDTFGNLPATAAIVLKPIHGGDLTSDLFQGDRLLDTFQRETCVLATALE